jgi:hypothetical protein
MFCSTEGSLTPAEAALAGARVITVLVAKGRFCRFTAGERGEGERGRMVVGGALQRAQTELWALRKGP